MAETSHQLIAVLAAVATAQPTLSADIRRSVVALVERRATDEGVEDGR